MVAGQADDSPAASALLSHYLHRPPTAPAPGPFAPEDVLLDPFPGERGGFAGHRAPSQTSGRPTGVAGRPAHLDPSTGLSSSHPLPGSPWGLERRQTPLGRRPLARLLPSV